MPLIKILKILNFGLGLKAKFLALALQSAIVVLA